MEYKFDDILYGALEPDLEPPRRLNDKILQKAFQAEAGVSAQSLSDDSFDPDTISDGFSGLAPDSERRDGNSRARFLLRAHAVMLAACLALALWSITALAARHCLTLRQVASGLQDDKLAEAFSGEGAITVNETQVFGNYRITLLGVVSGEAISDYRFSENGVPQSDRFYAVTAIEHADGTPMPDAGDAGYGDEEFMVSPYISGLDPLSYNIVTFGGGYSEFVEDGVEYRLIDTGNVSAFADRTIYIGVSDGTFYKKGPFLFDESTGAIMRNKEYDGVNALFVLPLDSALADSVAAKKLIDSTDAKLSDADGTGTAESETEKAASEWAEQFRDGSGALDKEKLAELCRVLPETVGTFAPDADGVYHFSWRSEEYGGGSGSSSLKYLFPEDSPAGTVVSLGYSYSDGDLSTLCMETLTLNEDGTVTLAVYVPK